jgi:P22 coat protein - gene protein 5
VANTLLTDQHITVEALMILENELGFTKQCSRKYAKEFTNKKRGNTIYVRKPPRYTVRDGQAVSIQDTTQSQTPLVLNHQFGCDVEFNSQDLALSVSDFGRDILQPQIVVIANAIDLTGLQQVLNVPNAVGTPGTTPGTGATAQAALAVYAQAGALLDKNSCPRDGRRALVINEDAEAITVPNLSGLFQDQKEIADQYKNGQMGRALGFKWTMDQNVYVETIGSLAGTPLVNGTITPATAPTGTTLGTITNYTISTNGWTASSSPLKGGEIFTLAGVFGVNPVSRQSTGKLQQFTVIGAQTADGSGNIAALPIYPALITSGPYQTVTALPAANVALTFLGAASTVTPQNVAFHPDAFTFASVDLPIPGGTHMAARKSDDQLGISMRFVAAYDVRTDIFIGRFDVLCGWATPRPEWAVRVQG